MSEIRFNPDLHRHLVDKFTSIIRWTENSFPHRDVYAGWLTYDATQEYTPLYLYTMFHRDHLGACAWRVTLTQAAGTWDYTINPTGLGVTEARLQPGSPEYVAFDELVRAALLQAVLTSAVS